VARKLLLKITRVTGTDQWHHHWMHFVAVTIVIALIMVVAQELVTPG